LTFEASGSTKKLLEVANFSSTGATKYGVDGILALYNTDISRDKEVLYIISGLSHVNKGICCIIADAPMAIAIGRMKLKVATDMSRLNAMKRLTNIP
jgi:hypothetical protein